MSFFVTAKLKKKMLLGFYASMQPWMSLYVACCRDYGRRDEEEAMLVT